MITLCVTTTNRQDLLGRCLSSACAGSVAPDLIVIVDQTGRMGEVDGFVPSVPLSIFSLREHLGCEASAINMYLTTIPEERLIAHDDVEFGPESIAQLIATPGPFVIDASQGVLTYRDECVRVVGLYDTTISPNYFRYVDVDYEDRLAAVGIEPVVVDCGVIHHRDGTMKGYSPAELDDYYRRIGIAEANYCAKWGRGLTPGGSTIGRSQWRASQKVAQ